MQYHQVLTPLLEAAPQAFFEYAKACLRYDAKTGRFFIWDNGKWRVDYKGAILLRELFRDWLVLRQVEVCRVAEKEGFPFVENEYLLLEKWKAQKSVPKMVLECLKDELSGNGTTIK